VGPKLADRILSELKGSNIVSLPGIAIPPTTTTTIISDAVSALTNLGFNRERAYSAALNLTAQQGDITLGELIKLLLKELK
jgi:Holliday junction resolvasome RuvABC DNA-binding subunit